MYKNQVIGVYINMIFYLKTDIPDTDINNDYLGQPPIHGGNVKMGKDQGWTDFQGRKNTPYKVLGGIKE
jgi:hypothetical protein